jgi:enediyne biosynthesis protein CalE5
MTTEANAETNPDPTDQLRATMHGLWSAVAPAWDEHADYIDTRAAALTQRLLTIAALQPGEHVLELACGPGGAGLQAATRVAPGGAVVVSDVAPEMTAIAVARAERLGLRNVTGKTLDLEAIDQPDASYDAVLCRDGLMFALDPARATAEIGRVLRPGGRAVVAVWAARARNPWLGIVLDAVSAELGVPMPPPGIPGPFALGEDGDLPRALSDGGLDDVHVEQFAVPLRAPSFEDWWQRSTALAGPVSNLVRMQPETTQDAIIDRARTLVAPYEHHGALEVPGVGLLASARRAAR